MKLPVFEKCTYHSPCMNRSFIILCILLQVAVYGSSFAECHTEEEAIVWLREKLVAKEKFDKNIISIVRSCAYFQCRPFSGHGGRFRSRLWWLRSKRESISRLHLLARLRLSSEGEWFSVTDRSNLQKIQNLINSNRNDWSVISPAFQWAQGMNDVVEILSFHLD